MPTATSYFLREIVRLGAGGMQPVVLLLSQALLLLVRVVPEWYNWLSVTVAYVKLNAF